MKCLSLVLVAALLVATWTPIYAGNCGLVTATPYYHPTGVGAHYGHGYVTPVVQGIPVLPDFIYSSQNFQKDDSLLETVKALREQLQQQQSLIQKLVGGTASSPLPRVPSGADPFAELPAYGSTAPASVPAGRDLGHTFASVIKADCLRCHDAAGKNGIDLRNLDALTPKQLAKVQVKVELDKMPPKRPLAEADKKLISDYIEEHLR